MSQPYLRSHCPLKENPFSLDAVTDKLPMFYYIAPHLYIFWQTKWIFKNVCEVGKKTWLEYRRKCEGKE